MPPVFNTATIFLISTLFDLYIFVLLIRIVLISIRADFYSPISQFVTKLTQGIIQPLRRVIPNYKKIELASIVLIVALAMLKYFLLGVIVFGHANPIGLFISTL